MTTNVANTRLYVGFPVHKTEGDDATQIWNEKDLGFFRSMRAHWMFESRKQKLNIFVVLGIAKRWRMLQKCSVPYSTSFEPIEFVVYVEWNAQQQGRVAILTGEERCIWFFCLIQWNAFRGNLNFSKISGVCYNAAHSHSCNQCNQEKHFSVLIWWCLHLRYNQWPLCNAGMDYLPTSQV